MSRLNTTFCWKRPTQGSHVELRFTLQDPWFQDEWFVRGKLTLEAGEELTRASEDIKVLFSPPPAQDL